MKRFFLASYILEITTAVNIDDLLYIYLHKLHNHKVWCCPRFRTMSTLHNQICFSGKYDEKILRLFSHVCRWYSLIYFFRRIIGVHFTRELRRRYMRNKRLLNVKKTEFVEICRQDNSHLRNTYNCQRGLYIRKIQK